MLYKIVLNLNIVISYDMCILTDYLKFVAIRHQERTSTVALTRIRFSLTGTQLIGKYLCFFNFFIQKAHIVNAYHIWRYPCRSIFHVATLSQGQNWNLNVLNYIGQSTALRRSSPTDGHTGFAWKTKSLLLKKLK